MVGSFWVAGIGGELHELPVEVLPPIEKKWHNLEGQE